MVNLKIFHPLLLFSSNISNMVSDYVAGPVTKAPSHPVCFAEFSRISYGATVQSLSIETQTSA